MEILAFERKAALWIGERVVSRARAKARVPGLVTFFDAAEEIIEGEGNPPQHILQDLRMDARHVFAVRLHLRKLGALLDAADGFAGNAVSVASLLHRRVVQLAADRQPRFEDSDDFG